MNLQSYINSTGPIKYRRRHTANKHTFSRYLCCKSQFFILLSSTQYTTQLVHRCSSGETVLSWNYSKLPRSSALTHKSDVTFPHPCSDKPRPSSYRCPQWLGVLKWVTPKLTNRRQLLNLDSQSWRRRRALRKCRCDVVLLLKCPSNPDVQRRANYSYIFFIWEMHILNLKIVKNER